jgi:hypothetical protein
VIEDKSARFSLWMTAVLLSSVANVTRAGVWSADPVVGVSQDYNSNPALLDLPHTSQTDVALLVDWPVTYDGDAAKWFMHPAFRVGDTHSYTSLNSNFVHLNTGGEFDSERNRLVVTFGASRDSSLYQNYLIDGQSAVRRDGLTAELAQTTHLTERLDADVDVSALHVRYDAPAGSASLADYRYSSISPDLAWIRSERDRVTLQASIGRYDSLDGKTRSRSLSGQLGYSRAVTEIWSLNVAAGYTRQQNRLDLVEPEFVFTGLGFGVVWTPFNVESDQGSAVYSARLTRTGTRFTLNVGASRQEVPTGFAFLSRQTLFDLQLTYAISPRWSAGLHEWRLGSRDPSLQGQSYDRNVNWLTVNSTYHLTEQWDVVAVLARVDASYPANDLHLANNQVTLSFTYKFNHMSLQ